MDLNEAIEKIKAKRDENATLTYALGLDHALNILSDVDQVRSRKEIEKQIERHKKKINYYGKNGKAQLSIQSEIDGMEWCLGLLPNTAEHQEDIQELDEDPLTFNDDSSTIVRTLNKVIRRQNGRKPNEFCE